MSVTINNTACPDDFWAGQPFIAFGPGKDGQIRVLTHRFRELSERMNELSSRRYEAAYGPKADHVLLTRLDGERAKWNSN